MRQALALLMLTAAATHAQAPAAPSIDDLINLKRVGSPAISADGRKVAFTIRETNWDENAYETEIWIGDAATGQSRQVTHARKSSMQPAWSPDDAWLAFVSDRDGKRQLYRIALRGGEAERLTNTEDGVNAFAWSPSGKQFAFTMQDPVTNAMKEREKAWGDVKIEDQDQRYSHLHVLDLETKAIRQLTKGSFVVGSFDWSPDGRQIAFDHRITSDPGDGGSADISVVTVESGAVAIAVAQEGPDSNPRWSPDGREIAFTTAMGKPFYFYQNTVIASVVNGVANPRVLTDAFDENPSLIAWSPKGIHFSASERTTSSLYVLNPVSKAITKHAALGELDRRRLLDRSGRDTRRLHRIWPFAVPRRVCGRRGGKESQRHRRADRGVAETLARSDSVEEPGRRRDRGRAAQARGFPGRPPLSVAGRHSRRADGDLASGAVRERHARTRLTRSCRRARSSSSRTIAAAPATARSSGP